LTDRADLPAPPERRVEVTGGQGHYVGDHGILINLFGDKRPTGPVVAGNVPQAPAAFQPREDLMTQLRAAGPGVSVVRAVTGMRGAGKTQVAAAYARECRKAGWRLIAWVNAEDTPAVLSGLSVVADRLGIGRSGKSLPAVGLEVRNRLEADGDRCLIVFDNVTDPGTVLSYAPSLGDCRVVITSTEAAMAVGGGSVQVGVFREDEALAYLAGRTDGADEDGARLLAGELGFLPLALAQAAGVIAAERLSFREYLDRLRGYPAERYLRPAQGDPHPRGVTEAILLSIDAVTAADPTGVCATVLGVVSLLSPEGVPTRILKYSGGFSPTSRVRRLLRKARRRGQWGRSNPWADGDSTSTDIGAALGRLTDASLLAFSDDGSIVLAHRLVMRTVRERLQREGRLVLTGTIARKMLLSYTWILRGDNYFGKTGADQQWDRAYNRDFARQAAALARYLKPYAGNSGKTKAQRELRSWAEAYEVLGDSPANAITRAVKHVSGCVRAHGEQHAATLDARAALAEAYLESGRVTEAIEQLELVYSGRRRLLGEADPKTISAAGQLSGLYVRVGRVSEAGPLLALWLKRQHSLGWTGADSDLYVRSPHQTAARANENIPALEMYVSVFSPTVGEENLHTIQYRNKLASAYRTVGRLDEAIEQYALALHGLERAWGPENGETINLRFLLASAYWEAGRAGEAVPLLERVLAGLEQSRGAEHPDTAAVRENLAAARQEADRRGGASPA
jgi:tetratricopeptide (TPR) repeat protein